MLPHPASWKFVAVEQKPAGPFDPLGFLTDQHPAKQCTYFANGDSCGPPITKLAPGKVLVSVTTQYSLPSAFSANGKIAGLPAQTSTLDLAECPAQATYGSSVALQILGTTTTVVVRSCSASTSAASRAVIARMLSTATYHRS